MVCSLPNEAVVILVKGMFEVGCRAGDLWAEKGPECSLSGPQCVLRNFPSLSFKMRKKKKEFLIQKDVYVFFIWGIKNNFLL